MSPKLTKIKENYWNEVQAANGGKYTAKMQDEKRTRMELREMNEEKKRWIKST